MTRAEIEALIATATPERMSPDFVKHHLGNGRALHHFTGPDRGGPHDHPCELQSTVLLGGYLELQYDCSSDRKSWIMKGVHRRPGDTFTIPAERIHEIVALPDGECWTLVTHGPHVRATRFWRFEPGRVRSRVWCSAEWEEVA